MLYNVLLDVLVVFLAQFFVSHNGPVTKPLLTESALTTHDSILSLQVTANDQADDVLRLHCKFASRRDWDDKTGRKRAVGSVISRDLALSRPDVEQRIEKKFRLQCYRNLRTRSFLVNLIFILMLTPLNALDIDTILIHFP